jgi:hypothetical protein
MELLRIGDALVREQIQEAARTAPPGACPWCGGSGIQFDQIDEERPEVAVPCFYCRVFCYLCKRDVPKKGHTCNALVPVDQQ